MTGHSLRPLPAALPALAHTMPVCHTLPLVALQAQKTQLRSQLDSASKARESARASMKELRGSMKFTKGGVLSDGNWHWGWW